MGTVKEIKFRDRFGSLVGRKNRMTFIIGAEPGVPTGMPAYCVSVCSESGEVRLSTACHQYFQLDEAKQLCRRIAAGEVSLADLRAKYDAEDEAKLQSARRENDEKVDAFRARLAAAGLSCRDFLELEVSYSALGEMGRQSLLAAMREEGETRSARKIHTVE